ncbi:MAG: septal ring lytic transglycosylase RlpA family protein [Trichloromonadaceae bacterium]
MSNSENRATITKPALRLFALSLCCLLVSGCGLILPPREDPGAPESVGLASYYHDKFQGRRTASGEPFDQNALTAAHRSYPFGTLLRVHNLDNGKTVDVRINDRGPHISGRIIDLTRRAAQAIGMLQQGVARVRLRVLQGEE